MDTDIITPKFHRSTSNDLYSLELHLHLDHSFTDPDAFDRCYKFRIMEVVNPGGNEKKWIHKFEPHGINAEYPSGTPYIGHS